MAFDGLAEECAKRILRQDCKGYDAQLLRIAIKYELFRNLVLQCECNPKCNTCTIIVGKQARLLEQLERCRLAIINIPGVISRNDRRELVLALDLE